MLRPAALLLALALAAAPPAAAAAGERSPAERSRLADLARTLGEAHALRLVCGNEGDMTWRNRMARLIELEAPDDRFADRLRESFNIGFLDGQAAWPQCGAEAREAVRRTAARGRDLAQSFSPGRMETAAAR